MKTLVCAILLMPCFCIAQDKPHVTIAFGKDFPKHYHVIGGNFTGDAPIGKGFYLGAGSAILKFDNVEKFYFPLFANLSLMKQKTGKKIFPVVLFQPGYGFYRHNIGGVTTKGGFTFHSSAGIGYPFLFGKKGFATIGFAHYTFKTEGVSDNKTSWGGRLAIVL
jgi:hypothetical protein